MVVWVQNGCKCVGFYTYDRGADWELWLIMLSSFRREAHTAYHYPRKNQNPKFEVQFLLNVYRFHSIVKSQNRHKLLTVCTLFSEFNNFNILFNSGTIFFPFDSLSKFPFLWASLVAQWLRICLLMQRTRVQALIWEDPTCCGATGSVSHNY